MLHKNYLKNLILLENKAGNWQKKIYIQWCYTAKVNIHEKRTLSFSLAWLISCASCVSNQQFLLDHFNLFCLVAYCSILLLTSIYCFRVLNFLSYYLSDVSICCFFYVFVSSCIIQNHMYDDFLNVNLGLVTDW